MSVSPFKKVHLQYLQKLYHDISRVCKEAWSVRGDSHTTFFEEINTFHSPEYRETTQCRMGRFPPYDWPARVSFCYILSILLNCKTPIYNLQIVACSATESRRGTFHTSDRIGWIWFPISTPTNLGTGSVSLHCGTNYTVQ